MFIINIQVKVKKYIIFKKLKSYHKKKLLK
jgi:hypothetical protein